jgi:hypothetical protein
LYADFKKLKKLRQIHIHNITWQNVKTEVSLLLNFKFLFEGWVQISGRAQPTMHKALSSAETPLKTTTTKQAPALLEKISYPLSFIAA